MGPDFQQAVRGVGPHPRRRGHGRRAAQPADPPLPHRQHPGQQLPDAAPRRTLEGHPPVGIPKHSRCARPGDRVMRACRTLGNRPAPVAPLPPPGGCQSVTFSNGQKCDVTFSMAIDRGECRKQARDRSSRYTPRPMATSSLPGRYAVDQLAPHARWPSTATARRGVAGPLLRINLGKALGNGRDQCRHPISPQGSGEPTLEGRKSCALQVFGR